MTEKQIELEMTPETDSPVLLLQVGRY